MTSRKWDDDEVIQRLRDYLRIPSVHPDIDYNDCVNFLKKQAAELGLPVRVYELVPKKPVVVMTWQGTEPGLESILLNSHMDVVPVYEEFWTHPPFEAAISNDGYIYARGIQDMKGVGMMHLESVRRLKNAGVRLKRTVHISFVPDEEVGGKDGMGTFSKSDQFKALNVGFEMDESVVSPDDDIIAFNGERILTQVKVTCRGPPAHGSLLPPTTAGEKFQYIINKFMEYRAAEKKKIEGGGWIGDVTTINLTMVEGGVQVNVIPENLSVYFDIRIVPHVDHQAFEDMIRSWCKEAGDDVTFEYILKNPEVASTKIDGSVPYWTALQEAVKNMGIAMRCVTCPGATDARFVRLKGIPAINFTPIVNTPVLLHAHDEKIHVDVYKRGIGIMEKVVQAVANV